MNKFYKFTSLLFVALVFFACSDSSNPAKTNDPDSPIFSTKTITLPIGLTNSSNEDAKELVDFIDDLSNFDQAGCCFACPKDATDRESSYCELCWEYQWACDNSLNLELKITSGTDRNTWQLYYNGSMDGATFNHWKRMDAVQTFDQSSGHVNLFIENSVNSEVEWIWYHLEDESYRFDRTIMIPEKIKMSLKFNKDSSGEFEVYTIDNGQLRKTMRYIWYVNGKGEWWQYENDKQIDHGIWG